MSIGLQIYDNGLVTFFVRNSFDIETQKKCRELFKEYVSEKKITGTYDDNEWVMHSSVKNSIASFEINKLNYKNHIGKEFGISIGLMKEMLKCYVVYCIGNYVFKSITNYIRVLTCFMENYGDKGYRVLESDISTIVDFLFFINTPNKMVKQIETVLSSNSIRDTDKKSRKLSPLINYLVIEQEINDLYSRELDDETFVKWFPIYFWVNLTFRVPLRATEMLLTPKDCIVHKGEKVYIKVRRTKLKGRKGKVFYDYTRDYKVCEHDFTGDYIIPIVEKYISLTEEQDRRFLFAYSKFMLNEIVSLSAFNKLLAEFIDEYIIGNSKYDYAKYASGIKEFEYVTAGDSRPIAMTNLYFQGVSADICRELAGHKSIETSAGYFSNVAETVMGSSIMRIQKKINNQKNYYWDQYLYLVENAVDINQSFCASEKRLHDNENIEDCEEQNHLEDCIGCKYFIPSKKEINKYYAEYKEKVDIATKRLKECLALVGKAKGKDIDIDEMILQAQTATARYKIGCDYIAEEKREEWLKHKSSRMTSC